MFYSASASLLFQSLTCWWGRPQSIDPALNSCWRWFRASPGHASRTRGPTTPISFSHVCDPPSRQPFRDPVTRVLCGGVEKRWHKRSRLQACPPKGAKLDIRWSRPRTAQWRGWTRGSMKREGKGGWDATGHPDLGELSSKSQSGIKIFSYKNGKSRWLSALPERSCRILKILQRFEPDGLVSKGTDAYVDIAKQKLYQMRILLSCLIWGKYPILEKLKWRWGPKSENALRFCTVTQES